VLHASLSCYESVAVLAKAGTQRRLRETRWIPAFAGMTRLFPIAATLRVLLSDIRVTS
jgi:hypothetical protein